MYKQQFSPTAFIDFYLRLFFALLNVRLNEVKRSLRSNRRGAVSMGRLFIAFILIIIGIALTPTVVEQVADVTGDGGNNLTGSASALMSLLPMFWVIGILGVAVALIYLSFKDSGA